MPYLRVNPYLQMGFGEDDDEFDAIIAAYVQLVRPPAPRVFRDRANPLEEFNEEFRARFLVTKHATTGMLYIYLFLILVLITISIIIKFCICSSVCRPIWREKC